MRKLWAVLIRHYIRDALDSYTLLCDRDGWPVLFADELSAQTTIDLMPMRTSRRSNESDLPLYTVCSVDALPDDVQQYYADELTTQTTSLE